QIRSTSGESDPRSSNGNSTSPRAFASTARISYDASTRPSSLAFLHSSFDILHSSLGGSHAPPTPLRPLHRPEPPLPPAGRTLATLRSPRLRPRLGLRPLRPAQPPHGTLLRGLAPARRPRRAHRAHPHRRPRQLQHLPPPRAAGEGSRHRRSHLQRPPRR